MTYDTTKTEKRKLFFILFYPVQSYGNYCAKFHEKIFFFFIDRKKRLRKASKNS